MENYIEGVSTFLIEFYQCSMTGQQVKDILHSTSPPRQVVKKKIKNFLNRFHS